MKILMLGLINYHKNDAAKIHFTELSKSFVKNGMNVDLLVPKNFHDPELSKSIKIYNLPFNYTENFILIFLLSILQIIYYLFLSSKNYDFVYIRWRLLPCYFIQLIKQIKNLKTEIITEHNGWIELETKIQRNSKIYQIVGKLLQISDAKYADKIVTVTDGIKNQLIKNNIKQDKIHVVGNGTNITHFYPLRNISKLKQKFLGNDDKIVLGFIGNISKWQELDTMIDAFENICNSNFNVTLLIIGSGTYLKEIKKKIEQLNHSDKIILKNDIDYKDMNLWMNVIDIALAAKSKILDDIGYSPLKIRDYAAAGKPIISTNVTGIREYSKYKWLRVFEPGNIKELQTIIEDLINDRELLGQMSIDARKFAKQNFSWDVVAKRIQNLF